MPAAISFTVFGETQLERTLLRVSSRTLNALPAFEGIESSLENQAEAQFDSEGGRASGGWAPLAPSTIEFKSRAGYPLDILRRTDDLKDSLTRGSSSGAIRQVSPQMLVFGSSIDYGEYHQSGTSKMPRRRPFELTNTDRVGAVRVLQTYIMTGKVISF